MLGDALLTYPIIWFVSKVRVIPASLDETRNLLTSRWEVAITSKLNSTMWVDPESLRYSTFRVTGSK